MPTLSRVGGRTWALKVACDTSCACSGARHRVNDGKACRALCSELRVSTDCQSCPPLDSYCPHPVPAEHAIQDDAREAMVASGPVSASLRWTASDQTSDKHISEKQASRRYHSTHTGAIQLRRSFLELNSRGGIQAGVPGQLRWDYRARRR